MNKKPSFNHGCACLDNVTPFLREFVCDFMITKTGETQYSITNPVIMVLNQQRLARVYGNQITDWLDTFKGSLNSEQLKDDQLLNALKSRYDQSPVEVQSYLRYLDSLLEAKNEEAIRYVENLKKEISPETPPSPEVPTAEQ